MAIWSRISNVGRLSPSQSSGQASSTAAVKLSSSTEGGGAVREGSSTVTTGSGDVIQNRGKNRYDSS
jgi:hypothetical protein